MTVSLRILGSGTSQGVPAIGCECETCVSSDTRDKRSRPSALFMVDDVFLLVDTSSDFRRQMLTWRIPRIDAVLYTHHHFDHISGFDDLRQYNFMQNGAIHLYGLQRTLDELTLTFRYAFDGGGGEGGGVPLAELHAIDGASAFDIAGVRITPLPVMHGSLPVLGYRIGDIAYVTDVNHIDDSTLALLGGLDALVLDALRHTRHPTHFSLDEASAMAARIGARRTYFTHIAHSIRHDRDSALLPPDMEFSYDGLLITSGERSQ
jgi:phosphoribosyl 1,2-cyclic phosphate phosphodiesterase